MNTFDKKTLKVLREEIDQALDQVAQQHNIKIATGNCSYLEDSCTFKLECSLPNALKKTERDLETELEYREQSSIALTLDRTKIAYNDGNHFKLVGYKTRARKNPFIIEKVIGGQLTGDQYICTENYAEKLFGDDSIGTPKISTTIGSLTETDRNGTPC